MQPFCRLVIIMADWTRLLEALSAIEKHCACSDYSVSSVEFFQLEAFLLKEYTVTESSVADQVLLTMNELFESLIERLAPGKPKFCDRYTINTCILLFACDLARIYMPGSWWPWFMVRSSLPLSP